MFSRRLPPTWSNMMRTKLVTMIMIINALMLTMKFASRGYTEKNGENRLREKDDSFVPT